MNRKVLFVAAVVALVFLPAVSFGQTAERLRRAEVTPVLNAPSASTVSFMQVTTFTVEPGKPIEFVWNHTGEMGAKFLVRNGTTLLKDFTAADYTVAGGVYTTKPGVVPPFTTTGTFTLSLVAYNVAADGTRRESPPLVRTVVVDFAGPPPPASEWLIRASTTPGGPVEELRLYNLESLTRVIR